MGRNDDDEFMGDKLVAPPDFHGPTHDRKCTDVFCMLLLVICWGIMTALGVQAWLNGDYRVILYPLDFEGNVCGTTFGRDMTKYEYLMYINNYGGGVCVEACPSLKGEVADDLVDIKSLMTYSGIFQVDGAEINDTFISMPDYSNATELVCTEEECYPDVNDPSTSWGSDGVNKGNGYAYFIGDSFPLLSWCILTQQASDRIDELVGTNATLSSVQAGYDFW